MCNCLSWRACACKESGIHSAVVDCLLWLMERIGDVSWTRGILEMKNVSTPDQTDEARAIMPMIDRLPIRYGQHGLDDLRTAAS